MLDNCLPRIVFYAHGIRLGPLNVLGGALEKAGLDHLVEMVWVKTPADLERSVTQAHQAGRPTLAAWSFFSPGFAGAARLRAAIADKTGAGVLHVAGGAHCTAEPRSVLAAGFDLAAVNDGEATFAELVAAWIAGHGIHGLPGTWTLIEGRPTFHGRREQVTLDEWPPFAPKSNHFNAIEITRGCVYACRFCQTPYLAKARFRHRSIESIRRSVTEMRRYGLRDLRFITPTALSYQSDGFAPNLDAVEDLLRTSREALGPEARVFFGSFPSEARPEHVDDRACRLLKTLVDNDNIVIGAQSGSDRMLALCNRGHSVEDVRRATRAAVKAGFKTYVDIIFGLPGEGPEDVDASFALADELAGLGAKIHAHTFMPLPGTPWAGLPPPIISPELKTRIERLASGGKLFGQWKTQAGLAAPLAALSTRPKSTRVLSAAESREP